MRASKRLLIMLTTLSFTLLFSSQAHSFDKGVDFINPQHTGNLIEVDKIEKMFVLSNLHVPKALFTALVSDGRYPNTRFTVDLYKIIYQINKRGHLNISTIGENQNIDFIVSGNSEKLSELKYKIKKTLKKDDALRYFKSVSIDPLSDRWFQDWGEFIGYGSTEHGDLRYGIYYVNRGRNLGEIVKEIARITGIPFMTSEDNMQNSGNFGGNLESTPDGIIFHGDTMSSIQVNQISKYGNFENMLELETNWLVVGHVDEMFSIIPSNRKCNYPEDYKGPNINYSIVVADPIDAFNLILGYDETLSESLFYSASEVDYTGYNISKLKEAIRYFLKNPNSKKVNRSDFLSSNKEFCLQNVSFKFCDLVSYNIKVSDIIESNLKKLVDKTPCKNNDVVRLPQFYRKVKGPHADGIAFLPGSVNMVSLRDSVIVPDPTFWPFKKVIKERLNSRLSRNSSSNKVYFIKEKKEYHDLYGEVHCGTNVMREPNMIWSN